MQLASPTLSLVALGLRHEWASRLRSGASPADADRVRRATLRVDVLPAQSMKALSVEVPELPASGPQDWVVAGMRYSKRADANKALAASLGTYTPEEWALAQKQHGLR